MPFWIRRHKQSLHKQQYCRECSSTLLRNIFQSFNKYFLACYQSGVRPEDVELRDAGVGVAVVLQVLQQQGEGGEEEAEYEGHLGDIPYYTRY